MLHVKLRVITDVADLHDLEAGTRIATNNNKLLLMDDKANGGHWYEEGELTNYEARAEWLPAIVLPPVIDIGPQRLRELINAPSMREAMKEDLTKVRGIMSKRESDDLTYGPGNEENDEDDEAFDRGQ